MKTLLFSALVAIFCGVPAGATEFQKVPAASAFDAGLLPRDPFVPLDAHKPTELVTIQLGSELVEEAQLARFFRVSAFSIGRLAIALINGTAVAEGESFTVRTKSGNMRIRLLKVK